MKTIFFILLLVMVTFTSCVNTKWVTKNNKFYKIEQINDDSGSKTNKITIYTVKEGFKANIDIKSNDGYMVITPENDTLIIADNCSPPVCETKKFPLTGWRSENAGEQYYFPESKRVTEANKKTKFIYRDSKPELQALTIPIKIRPKLTNAAYKDSFPQQAESGFNVDLAFGWKINVFNVYNNGKKGVFGQDINTWSVTPGVFMGLGTTALNAASTRNPVIEIERNAATVSSGLFLMFGFNNINIGGAIGVDNATGTGKSQWVYQGKLWYGLILGIDLLK